MKTKQAVELQLEYVLDNTDFAGWLGKKTSGKARDNYVVNGYRFIVPTDRVSAFDHPLGCIPFKGHVVTEMSAFWFSATRDIISNHLLAVPDNNVLFVRECSVL